jgi:hypothetical protein
LCKAPGYDKFGFQPPCERKEEEVDGVCCSIPCPAPPYQGFGTKSSDGNCKHDFEEIVENEHLGSVCCEVEPKCPEEKGYKGHGSYRYGDEECNNYSILQDNGICCYPVCPEPRYYKYSAINMGADEEECAKYYHSEMVTHADSGTTMCCTISIACPTDKYLRLGELPTPDGTCRDNFLELVEGVCCIPLPPTPPGIIIEPMWTGPPTKPPILPPGVIVGGGPPSLPSPEVPPPGPPAPPVGGPKPPRKIVEPMWKGPPTEAPKLPPGVIVGGAPTKKKEPDEAV